MTEKEVNYLIDASNHLNNAITYMYFVEKKLNEIEKFTLAYKAKGIAEEVDEEYDELIRQILKIQKK